MQEQLAGWLLMLTNLTLPTLSKRIMGNFALMKTVYFILLAHQTATLFQVYVEYLPQADRDPVAFNRFCFDGKGHLNGLPYLQLCRTIYLSLGKANILGSQISALGFVLALLVFVELIHLLGYEKQASSFSLALGMLPSVFIFTSVFLRESWQLLGMLLVIDSVLRYRVRGPSGKTFAKLALGTIMLCFLHNALPIIVAIWVPCSLLWAGGPHNLRTATAGGMFVVAVALLPVLAPRIAAQSRLIENLQSGNFLQYADSYQEKVGEARSSFSVTLDLSSPKAALSTAPRVYLIYLFSPFPWEVRRASDAYAASESMLRFALLLSALYGLRSPEQRSRKELNLYLIISFLFVEGVWSAGTANWGTAFRHRILAYPCLLLAGGLTLYNYLLATPARRALLRRRNQRKEEQNSGSPTQGIVFLDGPQQTSSGLAET